MTLGSWVLEPVAVCDIAVPLRLLSNAADRIAITVGATMPDEDPMTVSSKSRKAFAILDTCTIPETFN